MQLLWGKILAGEANKPGTFSRRTLNTVATLERRDAELFTRFCGFVWRFEELRPLVFGAQGHVLHRLGMSFDDLLSLTSLGLIHFDAGTGYRATYNSASHQGGNLVGRYFDYYVEFEKTGGGPQILDMGKALLTQTGKELYPIADGEFNQEYFSETLIFLAQNGQPTRAATSLNDLARPQR